MRRLAYVATVCVIVTQGCVVMRDPLYVNYAPTSVGDNPPDNAARPEYPGVFLPPTVFADGSAPAASAAASAPVEKKTQMALVCPEFRPPAMGEPPRLTAADFDRIDPKDSKALVKALTDHAEALYRYSQEYRARVQKEMSRQRRSCRSMYLVIPAS